MRQGFVAKSYDQALGACCSTLKGGIDTRSSGFPVSEYSTAKTNNCGDPGEWPCEARLGSHREFCLSVSPNLTHTPTCILFH